MRRIAAIAALVACVGCGASEDRLRRQLARGTGIVRLPAGQVEIHSELVVGDGAQELVIEGAPSGSTLRAAADFEGAALLVIRSARRVSLRRFSLDGNRTALEKPSGLPPSDVPFYHFTRASGILILEAEDVQAEDLRISNVAGFAVLAARSRRVDLRNLEVRASGGRNQAGRNNATGGILLEEGVDGFRVAGCKFFGVRGNGVWTHSLSSSPRNSRGRIEDNSFETIGRDAIQIGHATGVVVARNEGRRIGYPVDEVDVEGGGIPVAIDTAGNVDQSSYEENAFEEVNGKCIDLDGFHHGQVRANRCTNRGSAADYPHGHFGIVFNNSNPDMRSEAVTVSGNIIDGAKFGGIFVIGTAHRILNNTLLNLNLARCNSSGERYGCLYYKDEPDLLRSGIYLGRGAERPDPARGNYIDGNRISGYGMSRNCIVAAPGVELAANRITRNQCSEP